MTTMTHETYTDTSVDSTDYVCCCDCWADSKRREAVDGKRRRRNGSHTRGDSERHYVPEIRVVKQGIVKRRANK